MSQLLVKQLKENTSYDFELRMVSEWYECRGQWSSTY
jgi:hypothetical protein